MTNLSRAFAAILAIAATPLTAQEFTGGTLGVETFVLTDDFDIGTTAYTGGLEMMVFGGIGVAANASYFGLTALDSSARNLSLHGFYDLGGAKAGLFFALDDSDGGASNIYGLEGGADLGAAVVSGYLGQIDGDTGSGAIFGLDAAFPVTPEITATASLGVGGLDDSDLQRIGVGGSYALNQSVELFADVSRQSIDDGTGREDRTAIGLGARLVFGSNGGTTFGTRSIYDIAPSF